MRHAYLSLHSLRYVVAALTILAFAVVANPMAYAQNFTVLHAFQGPPDGYDPIQGSLILDGAGNLYGVTSLGGTGICDGGCGTVFMASSSCSWRPR